MAEAKPITVLQFGETGQVARELLRRDWSTDYHIRTFGRAAVDFTHPQSVADIVYNAAACDAVVNAAAYTAVDRAESEEATAMAVNGEAAGRLARACAGRGVPLIHLSTDYVFDGRATAPYREWDPVNPLNVYGRSKLAGEEAIRATLKEHIILRTSWVYSPYGANFLKTMLRLGMARDELRVVNDQIGAPTAATDIASAIHDVLQRLRGAPTPQLFGTFHYSAKGRASWYDFATAILTEARHHFPVKAGVTAIGTSEYPTPAERPANSLLDCSKIETVYGVRRAPWENGMRDVISRLAQEGGVS